MLPESNPAEITLSCAAMTPVPSSMAAELRLVKTRMYRICSAGTRGEQRVRWEPAGPLAVGMAKEMDMAQKSAGGNSGGVAKKGGQDGAQGGRGGGGKGGSGSGGATKTKGGGK
jgi:hypothetical protein